MTTKNFNAKKVLMSTVAAVVFSFVFTTNSDARPGEYGQKNNLEIRVKTAPNGDVQKNNLEIRVKTAPNGDAQQDQEGFTDMMFRMLQSVFGVRV